MTFDLFADEPARPVPATFGAGRCIAVVTTEDPVYALEPAGVNRWTYKGELITYDTHQLQVAGRGRWANVEGIGKPAIRGDSHRDICKAIDARSTQ